MTRTAFRLSAVLGLVAAPTFGQATEVDKMLPDYSPARGVSGTIKSVGSDTRNNMMALWAEGFNAYYPNYLGRLVEYGSTEAIFLSPMLRETEDYVTGRFG